MAQTKHRNDQLFAAPCEFLKPCIFKTLKAEDDFIFSNGLDATAEGMMLGVADAAHTIEFYEEGAFTPKLQDASLLDTEGQTYTTQLGEFTVYDNWVFFDIHLDLLSSGTLQGSGPVNIILEGAPAMKADGMGSVMVGETISMNLTGALQVTGKFDPATQSIRLMELSSTLGHSSVTITRFQNGAFKMSGFYEKA